MERETIIAALEARRGFMPRAGRQLGLTERMTGLRVKKHGIDPLRFRAAGEAAGRPGDPLLAVRRPVLKLDCSRASVVSA